MAHAAHVLYATKLLWFVASTAAQNDHGASVVIAGPPYPVAVVLADGVRQPVFRPEVINRRGFAPAIGKDRRPFLLVRWQAVIHARDFAHHIFPAKFVGKPLRKRTIILMFGFRRLQPQP